MSDSQAFRCRGTAGRRTAGGACLALALLLAFGRAPGQAQDAPYLVGEFKMKAVVDGDTIAVEGLPKTIRFLCIDTEECEKGPGAQARTERLARNFAAYARRHVREDPLATFNTPMGWEAKAFAERWFPVGSTVRIEYDSPSRRTGYYGRVLGYVFAHVDGKWVNYNVECVRAGMSPYFDKYGRSQRFEPAFLAAEREARIHGRGIWSPYAMAYPNYDERLAFWSRRARTLDRFEDRHGAEPNAIAVLDDDDWARLAGSAGKEVLLFGTVGAVNGRASPPILELHHQEFARIGVTFADADTFAAVQAFAARYEKDFLYVRGVLGPGFEGGGRAYAFGLAVTDPGQVFVDIPDDEATRIRFPRRDLPVTGDRIRWQDAPAQVGKTVSVVGTVVRTRNIGKLTFLNFDPDFRRTLTLVIREEHYAKFPAPPEVTYLDRTVLVRGKVTEHRGTPQIEVTGPDQIRILE